MRRLFYYKEQAISEYKSNGTYYSRVHYYARVGEDRFSVTFKYNDKKTVTVYAGNKLLAQDIDYEFLSSHTIKLKEPVKKDGLRITIRRDTDLRDRAVDFVNAAELTEADLDNSAAQVFYAMQEAKDNSQDTISPDPVGNWDIHDRNIVNLADGEEPHHGVNKRQLDQKDAEWNALEVSMKESIETMNDQIIEAGEHVNTAKMAAVEATDQANRAFTQADRAEDEADRAEEAKRQAEHSEKNAGDYEDQAAAYADMVRKKHGEIHGWHHDVKNMHSNVTDNTREVRAKLGEVEEKRQEIFDMQDAVSRDLDETKRYRNDALRYRDAASNSAQTAKKHEQETTRQKNESAGLLEENKKLHEAIKKDRSATDSYKKQAQQSASEAKASERETGEDRKTVGAMRNDVMSRQEDVTAKLEETNKLHGEAKGFRDAASKSAGEASK
ncbi:hypothetical protein EHW61_15645, partial [Salinivibrio sp. VYel6]|uniref:phage tail fiber domain-containing protein n=1 Tax=Salinivibrio sp. VYel6 TaxID=2490493 RepID=UPI00128E79E9